MALVPDLSGNGGGSVGSGSERHVQTPELQGNPFTRTKLVVPSDTLDLTNEFGVIENARGILVGVAGNIAYIPWGENTARIDAVAAGLWPTSVRRILASGTTATGLIAGR